MKRSELYALVWSTPVGKLGHRLGISGCGLTKLCERHGIPTPERGYWNRVAVNRAPLRPPLPGHDVDEVIPRFRALDAGGASCAPDETAVAWIVPGLVRRPQTQESWSHVVAREVERAAPADLSVLPAVAELPPFAPVPPASRAINGGTINSHGAPAPAAYPSQSVQLPRQQVGRPRLVEQSSLDHAAAAADNVAIAAALDAECERASAAAIEFHRRQALQSFLAAVTVRATQEDATAAASILAWVSAVRVTRDATDPVSLVVTAFRTAADGSRRRM